MDEWKQSHQRPEQVDDLSIPAYREYSGYDTLRGGDRLHGEAAAATHANWFDLAGGLDLFTYIALVAGLGAG